MATMAGSSPTIWAGHDGVPPMARFAVRHHVAADCGDDGGAGLRADRRRVPANRSDTGTIPKELWDVGLAIEIGSV